MNKIVLFSIIAALCATIHPATAETYDSSPWSSSLDLAFNTSKISVDNMPLEIRNVPIHKDDNYGTYSHPGPVAQKSYSKSSMLTLGGSWVKEGKHIFFGLGVDWILYPAVRADAERNYTNAVGTSQRGYGAALTFVSIGRRGIISSANNNWGDFFTNLTPTATVGIKLGNDWKLGADFSYQQIVAYTGWDRYDNLEIDKAYVLARSIPIGIYVQCEAIKIGVIVPLASQTDMGRKANAKFSSGLYIKGSIKL